VIRLFVMTLVCVATTLGTRSARAEEAASLIGIKGFYVYAHQTIALAKGSPLAANPDAVKKLEDESGADITRAVQDALRKAGIEVFTESQFKDDPVVPCLEVSEITLLDEFGTSHTAVSLAVKQVVTAFVNHHVGLGTTWSSDRLVVLGKESAKTRGMAPAVAEMMSDLVNDYLVANPRPSPIVPN